MGYDCSVMIRTDFRKRHDKNATLKKLKDTAAILNNAEGVNSYIVDTEETFDRWCIRPLMKDSCSVNRAKRTNHFIFFSDETPNLQLFSSETPMYRAFAGSWRLR